MEIDFGIYVKNSAEAVELYKEAFRLELGYHVKNPDGSYFHSELMAKDSLSLKHRMKRLLFTVSTVLRLYGSLRMNTVLYALWLKAVSNNGSCKVSPFFR